VCPLGSSKTDTFPDPAVAVCLDCIIPFRVVDIKSRTLLCLFYLDEIAFTNMMVVVRDEFMSLLGPPLVDLAFDSPTQRTALTNG